MVPDVYRSFIDKTERLGVDLFAYRIYHDTDTVIEGNRRNRNEIGDFEWKDGYLDFGVGDGCGNCYFLRADRQDAELIELWSHDPLGIEDVGNATKFFDDLLYELQHLVPGTDSICHGRKALLVRRVIARIVCRQRCVIGLSGWASN